MSVASTFLLTAALSPAGAADVPAPPAADQDGSAKGEGAGHLAGKTPVALPSSEDELNGSHPHDEAAGDEEEQKAALILKVRR